MAKKKFKEKRYLDKLGTICPYCTSSSVRTAGNTDTDGAHIWQNITCVSCESEWTDVYKLIAAEEVSNNT